MIDMGHINTIDKITKDISDAETEYDLSRIKEIIIYSDFTEPTKKLLISSVNRKKRKLIETGKII